MKMKRLIPSTTRMMLFLAVGVFIVLIPQQADAYAAWFVDRRISCLTELKPNEIVMNNKIVHHLESRAPSVHLDVAPLESNRPFSEYSVKFVVPHDAQLNDVQYVIELSNPDDPGASELPAKFTSAPTNGGLGCDFTRAHGRARMEDSPAIVTFNDGIKDGARIEVLAGWATGHEAVELTDSVVIVSGHGVDNNQNHDGYEEFDDYLYDDMIEAELEEEDIEEERNQIEKDIAFAEEDAVLSLEEKRVETEGMGSQINEIEEEVVEVLEANRKDVNKALNELKDEIILKQKEHAQNRHDKNIDEAKRKQAQQKHYERHPHLEDMERRFKDGSDDPRKEKLQDVLDMKDNLEESIEKLKINDMREHSSAKRRHIKPIPKEELKIDMQELKQKLKQKLNVGKLKESLGVNELFESKDMKMLRGKLKEGIPRGGESTYHSEKGAPLPPEGRHFLFIMFSFFLVIGFFRWFLDKRRRRKGRRVN